MKQSQIIKAYKILDKMNTKVFPIKLVHDLFMLKRALEPHVQFQTEKEQEVYSKYNPIQTEDGNLDFGSKEKASEFLKEYNALLAEMQNMDVELEFTKPTLDTSLNIEMSMEEMEALDPFVEFV